MIMFVSERVGCIKRKSIIKKTKIKAKQKQNLIKINILNDVYSKKKKGLPTQGKLLKQILITKIVI